MNEKKRRETNKQKKRETKEERKKQRKKEREKESRKRIQKRCSVSDFVFKMDKDSCTAVLEDSS